MPQDLHRQNNIIINYFRKANVGVRDQTALPPMRRKKDKTKRERRKKLHEFISVFKVTLPKLEADISLVKCVKPLLWGLLGNNNLKTTKICNTSVHITTIFR